MTQLTLLGVVPVLVNTGAALLPAVLAAVASAAVLLFKPRELWRICKARPYVPLAVVALAVGGYFGIGMMLGGEADAAGGGRPTARGSAVDAGTAGGVQTDWTRVALEILRHQKRQADGRGIGIPADIVSDDSPASGIQVGQPVIFRGGESRRGYGGGHSPVDLTLAWEYHAEDFAMILSSPVVVGGRVYGASTLLDPPSTYGAIFALDAQTGERLWQTQQIDAATQQDMKGFFSSPSVTGDGRYVLIGQGLHVDADCQLLCLDAQTGEVVWSVPTPLHVESSPAIEGDVVVVGAGAIEAGADRKPQGDPEGRGHPGYVFAVRISTGEELWRYQINDPESSPIIRDGVAYIGSGVNGNAVVALRVEGTDEELKQAGQERLLWRTQTPHPAVGAVTLVDGLVLVGCGNSDYVFADPNPAGLVLALDAASGEKRWQVDLPDSVLGPIAVHEGTAVAAVRSGEGDDGQRSGLIVALDISKQGRELWRYQLKRNSLSLAGPALTDRHVYAVSNDGYLRVLDREDGSLVEEHYVNQPGRPGEQGLSISSPFVADGRVYVGSETGGLRAYEGVSP